MSRRAELARAILADKDSLGRKSLPVLSDAPMDHPVDRSAFLYLEPGEGQEKDFAQCSTCPFWTGPEHQTCYLMSAEDEVKGTMTCGFYVHGKPNPALAGRERSYVTPKEAGLTERKARCENCQYFSVVKAPLGDCGIFKALDKAFPSAFRLGHEAKEKACCNAHTPIEE